MLRLRRWVNDPHIEIVLSILTPFIAYWPPEHLGGSGVLATVATGLHVSWYGPMMISARTRIQGVFFWDFFIYMIEGMVFLITGLQARTLIARIGDYSMSELAISAAVVSAVVITARFVWMYPATYLPRWLFPPLKRRDPSPSWRWPFLLAFTGVRGIVSLAAALAIPLATVNGQPFPYRDLILFLTFAVILVTLVGQGLMLPWVIRALGLATTGRRERDTERAEEHTARRQAIEAAIARLDQLAAERTLSEEIVQPIRSNHYDRLKHIKNRGDSDDSHRTHIELRDEIERLLLAAERQKINELYRSGRLKDETRRRIERELDVREAHLANQRSEE
jgi:CPA1 family monovalent cation:H+ antiporter